MNNYPAVRHQTIRLQMADSISRFAAEKYLVPSDWWRGDQAFRSECTPSVCFADSSSYGKATHDDLRVASLLQIMFAATPEGEPRFAADPLFSLYSSLFTILQC